jgi:hypothetical protein
MKIIKKLFIISAVFIGTIGYAVLLESIFYTWSFTRDKYLIYFTKPYRHFVSPDGQFVLELYDYMTLNSYAIRCLPMRGGSEDYPGIVILRDKNGNILNHMFVEAKSLVEEAFWENNIVRVPAIIIWDLPSPKSVAHPAQ